MLCTSPLLACHPLPSLPPCLRRKIVSAETGFVQASIRHSASTSADAVLAISLLLWRRQSRRGTDALGRSARGALILSAVSRLALDPGRLELEPEYQTLGKTVLRLPLQCGGGSLQVTRHDASEQALSGDAPLGTLQEWRALRFLPANGTTTLVQSIAKVCVAPEGSHEPQEWARPDVLALPYSRTIIAAVLSALSLLGAPVIAPRAGDTLRFLCIGLGGGSVPAFLAHFLSHCKVDVAELEPTVLEAARAGMGLVTGPRLSVMIEDGVVFVQAVADQASGTSTNGEDVLYDAIIIDAYDADGNVPEALWIPGGGFVRALSSGLLRSRGGLIAVNLIDGTDVARPLAAYSMALARRGQGLSFSVQDREDVSFSRRFMDFFTQGGVQMEDEIPNISALHLSGGSTDLQSMGLEDLRASLLKAGSEVSNSFGCSFDMGELAVRGLRRWPS